MTPTKKFILCCSAAAVVALATSVPVIAKNRMGAHFEQMDTNGDGYLDKAELKAAREARFTAMDANGDGALTADEISNHRADKMAKYAKSGKRGEARFKKLDTDGNGTLSKEEFDAGMSKHHAKRFQKRQARMMEHLDANKDVQNIDLMILANFCRNCLSKWYLAAAEEQGVSLDMEAARERVYGMPYAEWKKNHQPEATAEQLAAFEARGK